MHPENEHEGGVFAKIFADLSISMGKIADHFEKEDFWKLPEYLPANDDRIQTGACNVSGQVAISLGKPSLGRIWQVRSIFIGGATVTTSTPGSAWVFIRPDPPNDLNTAQAYDIATSLPMSGMYGTGQLIVRPNEHLYVVVTGGSSGQAITARAMVDDWVLEAFLMNSIG